ncbi:cilia- and flagella-associated protein 337-like isoform X2 [Ascaphus truei]|uniref:cilia- and flagella-associated protein 337-like isoform X2 n=1 Tax=Ascaphus truei TaxID=8439 RepID=UPI003F5ACDF7
MEHFEDLEAQQQQQQCKQVCFHLPATVTETPHREPFIQISPMPDSTLLGVGQDGLISVWTPDLKLKKSRLILDENKLQNRKMKWIADSTLMPQYNKLIVGTCDREIRLYELSNFEPYCQIIGLDTMPLHLGYSPRDTDECVIYFGDEQGCVNMILISHMAETLRNWTKCEAVDDIPSISMDNIKASGLVKCIRWKVHNDWITEIRYIHSIESIISSSNDDYTALVIGCVEGTKNLQKQLKDIMDSSSMKSKRSILNGNVPPKRNICDESVFRVKRGIKTFDFCKESNILVTGGLDRIVRLWNPYVPGWPIGLLRGHLSPIAFLCIADENTKIYSVSTDSTVMVWDIEDHTCLISVIPKASRIRGELAACCFSPQLKTLFIATDSLAALQLQDNAPQLGLSTVSHNKPVTCCQYNQCFQQVVSCSEGSVIKTWDLLTGQLVSEVGAAHGSSAVTCLALESSGNRMVTGGRDGSVKKWNYSPSSVSYIQTLIQASLTDEVSDCTYAELHNNRYIISVSCDRQINIFPDADISDVQYPQTTLINNMRNGHNEEILCVASMPPNLVATASFDGEILVWNLISGNIFCRLNTAEGEKLENGPDDLIINKVVFICSRNERKDEAAVLVASGPRGQITFWNIFGGGKVFGSFAGSNNNSLVSDMAISEDDSTLCAADQLFNVYIWNISEYALHGPEEQPPTLLHCWRAHLCDITRVVPVIEHGLVVSSSLDCTVRLWSMRGEYIGTFGQRELWDIKKKASWKEQFSASNLTTQDPPSQPVSGTKPSLSNEEEKEDTTAELVGSSVPIHDKDIAEELKKRYIVNSENRGRLVGTKHVGVQQTCGRLNAYQSLQMCDLIYVSPNIQKPNPAAELNDPFDLAF